MRGISNKWVWLLLIGLILVGCNIQIDDSPLSLGSKGRELTLAYDETIWFIVNSSNVEDVELIQLGAKKAAEELWVNVEFLGANKEIVISDQIAMVEAAIHQNASAIILLPVDKKALIPVIEKAVESGIPVVTIDSGVESEKPIYRIETDNRLAAALAAKHMAGLIGKQGKVAIFNFNTGKTFESEREKGFRDEMTKYPAIEIMDTIYSGKDITDVLSITQNAALTDIKGIFATNKISTIEAAIIVEEKGIKDQVVVVGFGSSKDEINLLEREVITGLIVQNYFKMGYLGIKHAVHAVKGVASEKKIYTEAALITKDNMNSQENQMLLYPFGN